MRIAQVAPLYESVPPLRYGGTERVVHYLTEELVAREHEVTLYASGDSQTAAHLVPMCERALWRNSKAQDRLAIHFLMLERVFRDFARGCFDIIHFHIDYLHFPISRRELPERQVTTLHGRLDIKEVVKIHEEFLGMPLVSISDAQRLPVPQANWRRTVYHGLPLDRYRFVKPAGDYLVFLGRVSPEKRLDHAIAIARGFGMKLKVAAKIDPVDRLYYEKEILHLMTDPLVEFLGEVDDQEKNTLLGGAYALLFPIDWPEPFGVAVIEALACGTPVVAFRRGSVPEVIEDGVTGYIVNSVEEAIAVLPRIASLDRARCRRIFETRYSASRMADDYLEVYEELMQGDYLRSNIGRLGMDVLSKRTTNHKTVKRWVEDRNGWPAHVRSSASADDVGFLRIHFPGDKESEDVEPISWEEFFKKFDEKELVFIYQEETPQGRESRFCKLISAETERKQAS